MSQWTEIIEYQKAIARYSVYYGAGAWAGQGKLENTLYPGLVSGAGRETGPRRPCNKHWLDMDHVDRQSAELG